MTGATLPHRLDSRLRGNDGEGRGSDGEGRGSDGEGRGSDGEGRGSDGERLVCLIHPLIPVSGTGSPSPLIPLPSRERGILSIGFVRVSSKFLSGRGYQCDV